jgi:hypothetical protein
MSDVEEENRSVEMNDHTEDAYTEDDDTEDGEEEAYETFDREGEDVEEDEESVRTIVKDVLDSLLKYKKDTIESNTNGTEDMDIVSSIEGTLRKDSDQLKMWIITGDTGYIENNPKLLDCVKGVGEKSGTVESWPNGVRVHLPYEIEKFFVIFPFVNTREHLEEVEKNGS